MQAAGLLHDQEIVDEAPVLTHCLSPYARGTSYQICVPQVGQHPAYAGGKDVP